MTEDLFSRRDMLRFSALLTAAGAMPFLNIAKAKAHDKNEPVKVGYLPITDATALLVAHGKGFFEAEGLAVEKPVLFRSWSQIVEAFFAGQINVIHVLSPIAIWARYSSQAPIKVVAWNHMSGSGFSVANDINSISDLGGRNVAIPFWYSIHTVVLQMILRSHGLTPVSRKSGSIGPKEVNMIIMAPSDMIPAVANGQVAGFIVAEPFNAAGEAAKVSKLARFTADVWRDHACCLVCMQEADLKERPEWSQKVVDAMVKAQLWTSQNREETAQLLAKDNPNKYTPFGADVLKRVLVPSDEDNAAYEKSGAILHPDWREKRIDFQPYPYPSYTEELVRRLKDTMIEGDNRFLETLDPSFAARDLVDDRLVKNALQKVGGMPAFGMADSFVRQEQIAV
ncbi:ABC transporter substrate-binding protein [Bartonella sp. LJL80]